MEDENSWFGRGPMNVPNFDSSSIQLSRNPRCMAHDTSGSIASPVILRRMKHRDGSRVQRDGICNKARGLDRCPGNQLRSITNESYKEILLIPTKKFKKPSLAEKQA